MWRHRHQGPILWGPSVADRLPRSIAARNNHAGSTGTVAAGSPAQAPAPLQPVVTQGLRSSATTPRSPLLGHPSPSPTPSHAARAPNSNAASSSVRSRAASNDTSFNSSEARAAAVSPRAFINRSVAPARSPVASAYVPGFSTGFLASAAHHLRPAARRAASPTLPDRPASRQASSPEEAAVRQVTGALLSCSWICCMLSVHYSYMSANMLHITTIVSCMLTPCMLHLLLQWSLLSSLPWIFALFCLTTSLPCPCRRTCQWQHFPVLGCKAVLQRALELSGVLLVCDIPLQQAWDAGWNEAVCSHSCCAHVLPRLSYWGQPRWAGSGP